MSRNDTLMNRMDKSSLDQAHEKLPTQYWSIEHTHEPTWLGLQQSILFFWRQIENGKDNALKRLEYLKCLIIDGPLYPTFKNFSTPAVKNFLTDKCVRFKWSKCGQI